MLVTHRMVQPTPTTSPARDSEAASPPPRLGSPEDPRARHTSLPSIVVRPSTSAASAGSRPVKKRSVAVNSSEDESPDLRKKRIEEWSRETLLRISRSSSDDVKMKEEHRDSNPETKMKLEESKGEDNDQPQDLSVRRRDQECQTESTCDREEATTSKVKRRKRRSTSPIPSFAVKKRPMTSEVKTEENDDDEEEEEAKEDKTPPSNAPLPQTELVLTYLRKLFMRAMCQLLLRPRQANLIGSLEEIFRSPDGLIRNVSLHQSSATGNNESNAFNNDIGGFGAAMASLGANASSDQSNLDMLGISPDSDFVKALLSDMGNRELQDVETEFDQLLRQHHQQQQNQGSFEQGVNGVREPQIQDNSTWSQARSGSQLVNLQNATRPNATNDTSDFTGEALLKSAFGNFNPASSSSSAASSAGGASGSGLPFYPAYHPYMAAAAANRFSQQYTPLVNHSYAAVSSSAGAASSVLSPNSQQMEDLETASQTSGKSNRSKDFSFDSGSIKADPDGIEAGPSRIRCSRDEKRARELGIPFSIADIVNLPMDEFNDMLSRHELNEDQLNLCRDIRRRGKNKVAAQNCRKRKIDQIAQLEKQVEFAHHRKRQLLNERQRLMLQVNEWQRLLAETERDILAAADKTGKGFYLDLEGREAQIVPLRQASTSTNSAERFAGGATAMTSADQMSNAVRGTSNRRR